VFDPVLARSERATYADVEAASPDRIAELIDGVLTRSCGLAR
jgi:hypothetical protein